MIPQRIGASQTLALNQKVKELKARGEDIVSFAAGESDFESPPWVVEAAYASMKAGDTKYAPSQGVPSLREAIAKDIQTRLQGSWVSSENILISAGAKQGIHLVFSALLEQGDEVLIPAPYWVSYPGIVKSVHGSPVIVETDIKNDFFPTAEELELKCSSRTKAVVLASPNNPTGGMISEDNLRSIVNWACEKKVLLVFDELYERLVFGEKRHVSPLSFLTEEQSEWVISVNAFSKAFSMTGWRIGFMTSHRKNIAALTALQSQVMTCLPAFLQKACISAMDRADEYMTPILKSFKARREVFVEEMAKVPGARAFPPEAAFYVLVDVREVIQKKGLSNDVEFADSLLTEKKVALTPGSAFGMPGFVRFTFAMPEADIKKGIARFKEYAES